MSHFPARYAGRCGNCNELFAPDAEVFYSAEDALVAWECCGEQDETRPGTSEVTPVDKVMPRGKTVRDRCGECFQIPASNGVCGCP